MTTQIRSYLSGEWGASSTTGAVLLNPTTEEVVAHAPTENGDLKRAVAFTRKIGGPALRELNFAQRGELLMAASKVIHEAREELIHLATLNGGNTRSDAKFDIDGAMGTLAYYANRGRKLGERHSLEETPAFPLTKNPRWSGRQMRVPKQGAAIHINAFNFPAWGMGEKLAAAILAGMPVLTKPGTSTALVAYRIAELWIEKEVFPRGAFSFLAGSPGDLLDHLNWHDAIAFTGSNLSS